MLYFLLYQILKMITNYPTRRFNPTFEWCSDRSQLDLINPNHVCIQLNPGGFETVREHENGVLIISWYCYC